MNTTTEKKSENIVPGSIEWFALVEKVALHEVGELVPHEWLRDQFDIKPLNFKDYPDLESVRKAIADQQFLFLQLFERLRKDVLKNHSFYLVNVRGMGYKIIHPKDQTKFAYDQLMGDISKSFKECADIMTHTRTQFLDEDTKSRDRQLFSKVGSLKQLFSGFKK